VQNDQVNFRDLWGLSAADSSAKSKSGPVLDMSNSGIRNPYEGVLPTIPFSSLSDNNQEKIKTLNSALWKDATNMMYQLQNTQTFRDAGITVEIVCAERTYDEQTKLYAAGRDAYGNVQDASKIVTNTKAGQSYHNFGLAFDVEIYNKDNTKNWDFSGSTWETVYQAGIDNGFDAGGKWEDFTDPPHFENTLGKSLKTLRNEKATSK